MSNIQFIICSFMCVYVGVFITMFLGVYASYCVTVEVSYVLVCPHKQTLSWGLLYVHVMVSIFADLGVHSLSHCKEIQILCSCVCDASDGGNGEPCHCLCVCVCVCVCVYGRTLVPICVLYTSRCWRLQGWSFLVWSELTIKYIGSSSSLDSSL